MCPATPASLPYYPASCPHTRTSLVPCCSDVSARFAAVRDGFGQVPRHVILKAGSNRMSVCLLPMFRFLEELLSCCSSACLFDRWRHCERSPTCCARKGLLTWQGPCFKGMQGIGTGSRQCSSCRHQQLMPRQLPPPLQVLPSSLRLAGCWAGPSGCSAATVTWTLTPLSGTWARVQTAMTGWQGTSVPTRRPSSSRCSGGAARLRQGVPPGDGAIPLPPFSWNLLS